MICTIKISRSQYITLHRYEKYPEQRLLIKTEMKLGMIVAVIF